MHKQGQYRAKFIFSILVYPFLWYNKSKGGVNMEKWKTLKQYNDWYEISNFGNFRSIDRTVMLKTKNGKEKPSKFKGRSLKQYIEHGKRSNIKPSMYVAFSVDGKHYRAYVHRLVAENFLHKPDDANKYEVNHKDGDRTNNHVSNLEWVSKRENIKHAFENKLIKTEKPVQQLDPSTLKVIKTFKSESEACRKMGVTQGKILRSIQRNGTCKGFKWKYTKDKNV